MNMKNKLIKSILIFAAWAIPVALLAWFAYTLIQNTKTQPQEKNQEIQITVNFNNKPVEGTETVETTRQVPVACPFSGERKTSEAKTIVKTTKSEPSERRVTITEDAFKETMQKVAYETRKEAQNEYDKNFTTLLTILTIFGIAWPVIIALLQFKFNESELNTIKQAQDNAQSAINKAEKAYNNNQDALKIIKKLSVIMKDAYVKSLTHSRCLFRTFNVVFSSVATEKDSAYANYYHALGLRCLVFGIQASNEIEITEDYIETMVENVKLITPEKKVTEISDCCLEFLVGCKDDLTKNINAKNSHSISQLGVFLHLLDEKIAEYKKLLAATDSGKK